MTSSKLTRGGLRAVVALLTSILTGAGTGAALARRPLVVSYDRRRTTRW